MTNYLHRVEATKEVIQESFNEAIELIVKDELAFYEKSTELIALLESCRCAFKYWVYNFKTSPEEAKALFDMIDKMQSAMACLTEINKDFEKQPVEKRAILEQWVLDNWVVDAVHKNIDMVML